MTRVSKKRTVVRINYSRGDREASATSIKVAGICTSNIKAEELDSPLAWGAGVVGGAIPTAGAAAAECVIGSREESDKSGRASSAGIRVSVGHPSPPPEVIKLKKMVLGLKKESHLTESQ
jgi:hypothetical protein